MSKGTGRRSSLEIYRSLKVWIGMKKRLPSHKFAASNFGELVSPHSIREIEEISLTWKWKTISLDPLPQVVEEWALHGLEIPDSHNMF